FEGFPGGKGGRGTWDVVGKKSTSGACQLLGGKLVCWSSKKQQFVAMSSFEAEYVAVARCCASIFYMKSQLTNYDIIYEKYQLANIFIKPLDEPTFKRLIVELASTIPLSKSASRNEALADSTTEVDLGKTYPNDSVSQQQGIVIGTKNFLFHHIFVGNDPHVLVKKTKSTSEGLETVLTQPATRKGASYVEKDITFTEKDASFGADKFLTFLDLSSSNDTKKEIKLEDLSKLVPNLDVDFLDLDSPEDDQPIIVKDEEGEEVHAKKDDTEKGDLIKKDKGKKAMSSKDAEEDNTESESDNANLTEQKKLEELTKTDMAKQEVELGKEELVDLLGINVIRVFYKAKLQYDKYCDKMLNRTVQSKITIYDVLIRKGPITLKVYRTDGTNEIIPNFKASDLYLSEWREVMQVFPNRKEAGWSTIYGQIKKRINYLHKIEARLEIDFNKPLSK
nr:hypothetical protein [Tanacetum cinerariifolium]